MSSDSRDFGLIKSFGIDHGELDGLRPQECFVLGYELAEIDVLLARGEAVSRPVHAANESRIRQACETAHAQYSLVWLSGDVSESWMQLDIAAKAAGGAK